jgi:hypothetical protein
VPLSGVELRNLSWLFIGLSAFFIVHIAATPDVQGRLCAGEGGCLGIKK